MSRKISEHHSRKGKLTSERRLRRRLGINLGDGIRSFRGISAVGEDFGSAALLQAFAIRRSICGAVCLPILRLAGYDRDLAKHAPHALENLRDHVRVLDVFSNDPKDTTEYLGGFDLRKRLDKSSTYVGAHLRELFNNFTGERHDVQSRGIVGISEEVDESMDNAPCYLGEFDGAYVNRLNEELSVFR